MCVSASSKNVAVEVRVARIELFEVSREEPVTVSIMNPIKGNPIEIDRQKNHTRKTHAAANRRAEPAALQRRSNSNNNNYI